VARVCTVPQRADTHTLAARSHTVTFAHVGVTPTDIATRPTGAPPIRRPAGDLSRCRFAATYASSPRNLPRELGFVEAMMAVRPTDVIPEALLSYLATSSPDERGAFALSCYLLRASKDGVQRHALPAILRGAHK